MVDATDEFIKRLKISAHEARVRQRDTRSATPPRPKKGQKQIPISLFHDMFGQVPEQYSDSLKQLKERLSRYVRTA